MKPIKWHVVILSEDGKHLDYDFEAVSREEAVTQAMDKSFERFPDGRFGLGDVYEVKGE